VTSNWKCSGGEFGLTVEIPVGAAAGVLVPAVDEAAVKAPRGTVFTGMQGGYAADSAGSGRYAFASAA
jgi:Bacterial alpha-L-rhamnosidase C-terminal domain